MRVPVSEAKAQLTDLVRRAGLGEDVILTRHGQPAARLVSIAAAPDRATRRRLMEALSLAAAARVAGGPSAARSQDFLYDEAGPPG